MRKKDDLAKVLEDKFAEKYQNTAGGGTFMTGMGVGAALGGAFVFFTKTEKGKKAWKKLKKEWNKSKSKMVKAGVLDHDKHELEDWLKHLMETLSVASSKSTKSKKLTGKTTTSKKTIKKPAKKRKRIRKKKETFKGV